MAGENVHQQSDQLQAATHLAARAVIALRCGFRVKQVTLQRGAHSSGITCDWKEARTSYGDDEKLIHRGFAFVYMGAIIDQKSDAPPSDGLREELDCDMCSVQEAREAAVEWRLVPSVMETNPFAHIGYKLASRLLRHDEELIRQLAAELLGKRTMNEAELSAWFSAHAEPLSLETLEQSSTF